MLSNLDANGEGMVLCPLWLDSMLAAKYLCISENALRIKVHRGEVTSYKMGRQLRYKLSDLQSLFTLNKEITPKCTQVCKVKKKKTRKFWTEENISKALLALKNNKIPLHYSYIRHKEKEKINKIISESVGRHTTGVSLIHSMTRKYGKWDESLKLLNIQRELNDKYHLWTKELVTECIQLLAKHNQYLSVVALTKSEESAEILTKYFNRKITGLALYRGACRIYQTWDDAVKDANVNFYKRGRPVKVWEKDFILDCIRLLAAHNLYLNAEYISTSKEVTEILYKNASKKISGKTLYKIGKKLFPTWQDAVRSSGLLFLRKKPVVRKKSPSKKKSNLPIIDYSEEYVYTTDGYKMTKLMGTKVKSPDNIFIEGEMPKLVSKVLKPKTDLERFVIERIIEKILDGAEDLDLIKQEIIQENKDTISDELILECLFKLKSSSGLKDIL